MSALEKLREDMWGEKYTRTTRKVIRKKKKTAKKPVGFYKDKKGRTRPITSGAKRSAAKPSRVVTRFPQFPRSRRGAHGWEIEFPSKSSPGTVHTVTFWTEDHKQFKEGDLSCNCPGWRYRRTCKHVKEVEQMAGVKAVRSLIPRNTRVADASAATRLKFDKAVKGARETGLVGFHMDPTHVMALLVDVNEVIQGANKDMVKFIQSLPRPPDASYRRITQASLGKSIKDAHDPKDRQYLFIRDTTYRKEAVKVALRTLGGRNIRIYSMGTDQPVFMMNDADEAVIIAPAISPTTTGPDDFLRLEDIAAYPYFSVDGSPKEHSF